MHERRIYYNIFEANAQIPRLEHLFAELARIQRQANELSRRAAEVGLDIAHLAGPGAKGGRGGNPLRQKFAARMRELSEEYASKLAEIEALGVIVDDLDLGAINFYSWLGGREIFLSWQYGEPEVRHWRDVAEGPMSRRPLSHAAAQRPPGAILH